MEITFDLIAIIHLAAVVLGILSSAVILFFGIKTQPANLPLGLGQLSISLAIFVSFSIVSQMIVHWPFLYRMGNVFVLIFIPMPYLYIIFYTKRRLWKWYDLLHAIPLMIFLVDYWDVFWMSSAQKTELILKEINDLDLYGKFNQGKFIGPGFHQEFRTVLFSLYWVAEVVLFVKWNRKQPFLTHENKVWRNWMILFLGCQFFLWFPFYLSVFWLDTLTTYHIVNSFSSGWLMVSSFSLFFFPTILYGQKPDGPTGDANPAKVLTKVPVTAAELAKLEEVLSTIESEMEDKKYFLRAGYSIHDFSDDIQIPMYHISRSLSTLRGLGFVDFTNQQRIRYCLHKFDQGEWLNYTLEAVATECGFSNRNSFTKAFIKFKGELPSQYRVRKK